MKLTLAILLAFPAVLVAQTSVLRESFDALGGSTNYAPRWDAGNANFPSASFTNIYQAGGFVKIGTGERAGFLQTRELNLAGGRVEVSFRARGWGSNGAVRVSLASGAATNVDCSGTVGFQARSVAFPFGLASDAVGFGTAASPKSRRRALLDDVAVVVVSNVAAELFAAPSALEFSALTNRASDCRTVTLALRNFSNAVVRVSATGGFLFSPDGGRSFAAEGSLAADGSRDILLPVRLGPSGPGEFRGALCFRSDSAEAEVGLRAEVTDGRTAEELLAWGAGGWTGGVAVVSNRFCRGPGMDFTAGSQAEAEARGDWLGFAFRLRKGWSFEGSALDVQFARDAGGPTGGVWQVALGNGEFQSIGGWTNRLVWPSGLVATGGTDVAARFLAWGASQAGETLQLERLSLAGYAVRGADANDPPHLQVSPGAERAFAGMPVDFAVTVTDAENGTVRVSAAGPGSLNPAEATGSGIFRWVPTAAGPARVTFTAREDDEPENTVETAFDYEVGLTAPGGFGVRRPGLRSVGFAWAAVPGARGYDYEIFRWLGVTRTVLEEGFGTVTNSGRLYGPTNGLASYSVQAPPGGDFLPGWSGERIYPAIEGGTNRLVRLGTADDAGGLETPELDLSRAGGCFTLTFRAARWLGEDDDGAALLVIVRDAAGHSCQTNRFGGLGEALNGYMLAGSGGARRTRIRFQSVGGRVFLDSVRIEGSEAREIVASGSLAVTTGGALLYNMPLLPATRYRASLRAKSGSVVSAWSDDVEVPSSTTGGLFLR